MSVTVCRRSSVQDFLRDADLRVPIRNRPVIRQYANSEFLNSDLPVLDALAIPGLKIETGAPGITYLPIPQPLHLSPSDRIV
jgi:hypothetical protein